MSYDSERLGHAEIRVVGVEFGNKRPKADLPPSGDLYISREVLKVAFRRSLREWIEDARSNLLYEAGRSRTFLLRALEWIYPAEGQEEKIGDIRELCEAKERARGRAAADRWLLWQVIREALGRLKWMLQLIDIISRLAK